MARRQVSDSFSGGRLAAKVFCSDRAWEVCNAAMELLGHHGYLHGQWVEKAARDARLTQIYEGTNQINRLAIFESQQHAEFGSSSERISTPRAWGFPGKGSG